MCLICAFNENRVSLSELQTLESINCNWCPTITEIPEGLNVKELNCAFCTNLRRIPVIRSLQILNCYGCPSLVEIPFIESLETVICNSCTTLTSLPHVPRLKILKMEHTNIKTIPHYELLETLFCSHSNVKHIHHFNHLKELECSNCDILEIPPINTLKFLQVINCKWLFTLPYFPNLQYIEINEGFKTPSIIYVHPLNRDCIFAPFGYKRCITGLIVKLLVKKFAIKARRGICRKLLEGLQVSKDVMEYKILPFVA